MPADDSTPRACYRSMSVPALALLRQAFELDARATDSVICRAFCAERIRLIGEVIREKKAIELRQREARAERQRAAAAERAGRAGRTAAGGGPRE